MVDNNLKKSLDLHEAAHRSLRLLSADIGAASRIQSSLVDVDRVGNQLSALLGPVEELRRLASLDPTANIRSQFEQLANLHRDYELQFRLPGVGEVFGLQRTAMELAAAATQYDALVASLGTDLRQAVEAMSTPWLAINDSIQSLSDFTRLQQMGLALRTQPVFGVEFARWLRWDLGDWRDRIVWSEEIFSDPEERTAFYVERGLNLGLTDFPTRAFEQAVGIAGIKHPPPSSIAPTQSGTPEEEMGRDGDGEADFPRANADAYFLLQLFETQVRKFIEEQMRHVFGEDWIKHRVPGDVRADWKKKREAARDNGEPLHLLVEYADFTHYEKVILRRDNWEQVFAKIFKRKTLVLESFQRLYPIRRCTMHARILTQEDLLYLYVETRRLRKAMEVVS